MLVHDSVPARAIEDAVRELQESSSPGPTSSPAPVSPSPGPTGATASPTASPTDSSGAVQGEAPQGVSCADGGVCAVGDPGPGGGVVFYAVTNPFVSGPNMASSCNFLEVAPNLWDPSKTATCRDLQTYCGGTDQTTSDFSNIDPYGIPWCKGKSMIVPGASGTVIGSGYANTSAILPYCNTGDAANVARSYSGGGLTDWSLASKDELNALYHYTNRDAIGGFTSSWYLSSSQDSSSGEVSKQGFSNGSQSWCSESSIANNCFFGVRPTRAF